MTKLHSWNGLRSQQLGGHLTTDTRFIFTTQFPGEYTFSYDDGRGGLGYRCLPQEVQPGFPTIGLDEDNGQGHRTAPE